MVTVSVVVPFAGDAERARNWAWIRRHYETLHPQWELVEAGCSGEWSKGAAVNEGAARATGDVLVIADADSFVLPDVLRTAVDLAPTTPWVMPHAKVRRLDETSTLTLVGAEPTENAPSGDTSLVRAEYTAVAGGGVTVLTRAAFSTVGGIDPRFLGWGGEDIAFGWALTALVGRRISCNGVLWHLWHPHPAPNLRGTPESEELVTCYQRARRSPDVMRELVKEAR